MPGLSSDPDAAQRQLDALKAGRITQARNLLATVGDAPAPPGHAPGHTAVHTYDDDPDPPEEPTHGGPGPDPGDDPEPPERRRRGRGFFDGLRAGAIE